MMANTKTNTKTGTKTNTKAKAGTKANANNSTRKASAGTLIVTDRESLNRCWLQTGNLYELIGKQGRISNRTLPRVSTKYEHVLQENGIPYRKVTVPNRYDTTKEYTMCEYWSPDLYEEETVRLTVFKDISDAGSETRIYQKCGMHEEVMPTYGTFRAAIETQKAVSAMVKESDWNKYYSIAQAALDGCDAGYGVGYVGDKIVEKEDGSNIMILQAHNSADKEIRYYGVFDMSHMNKDSVVTLYVPDEIAGMIIGKGAKNMKDWREKLGVKKINVEAVKTVKETEVAQA